MTLQGGGQWTTDLPNQYPAANSSARMARAMTAKAMARFMRLGRAGLACGSMLEARHPPGNRAS
jgi:hypothetical protein